MSAIDTAVAAVLAEHSQADTEEVRAGVTRVAERWTDADGDEQAMASFCKDHWVPAEDRHRLRDRLETALEQIHGHLYEARRVLRKWTDTRVTICPKAMICSRSLTRRPTSPSSCGSKSLASCADCILMTQTWRPCSQKEEPGAATSGPMLD